MEMEEGYTIYRSGKAKVKAIAEKRNHDGKLAVKVEPITQTVSFRIIAVDEGAMGTNWKYGEPCVKIHVEMVDAYSKKGKTITETTITVLTKFVDQFSVDASSPQVLLQ